mmetsp:Transcript_70194/g.137989  ORF Transcript_70194/g.137989 Transcript_70194/m.137989 type:complete len:246 (+) Transcript_70194:68-805(+)
MPPLRLPLFAFSLFIRSSSALQVTPSPNKTPRRLLAIDVGLRCGFATYDDFGFLLDFSSTHFSTRAELVENMPLILHTAATLPPATALTNVVLEGVPELCEEWRAAASLATPTSVSSTSPCSCIVVLPETWREPLLLKRERRNGHQAKSAARLIARQIITRFASPRLLETLGEGSSNKSNLISHLNTDAAEAILIGHYSVGDLQWRRAIQKSESLLSDQDVDEIERCRDNVGPLVQRFTNGNVVL